VDVGPPLPADAQSAVLVKPAERALDDPALAPQAGAVFGLLARDSGLDAAFADEPTVVGVVVAAVAHERPGAPARPAHATAHGRDRVEQGRQLGDVVAVTAGQADGQWDPAGIGQEVVL
jgi:hypothetical protein